MYFDWYGKGVFPNLTFMEDPPVTNRSKYPSVLVNVKPSLSAKPFDTLTPLKPCPDGVRTLPLITETFLK